MSSLEVKNKTIDLVQYKWEINLPLISSLLKSDPFFFYNISTIECYMIMKLLPNNDLEIRVNKGYYEPAKARITLVIGTGVPIIEDVNNWKDSHLFNNIPKASYESFLLYKIQKHISNSSSSFVVPRISPVSMGFNVSSQPINVKLPKLDIICTIEWFGFINNNPSVKFETMLRNLYLQFTFSDLEIRIGDVKLPAHKMILAMNEINFLNKIPKDDKWIEVTDVDVDTMKEILWYLYSGTIKPLKDTDSALKVLIAAVNYDIVKLKDLYVTGLMKSISTQNAVQILKVAYENKATELYKQILTFIKNNKEKIVVQKNFKDLLAKNTDLMYEFMMLLWQTKK